MPVVAAIVPLLVMPPEKVEIVNVPPAIGVPPTKMPMPAVMVPELLMPLRKVPIVTDPGSNASPPPTQMPFCAAEIVPELVMPPEKVENVTVAPLPVGTADPDAVGARRDRAGIADAAEEGRERKRSRRCARRRRR